MPKQSSNKMWGGRFDAKPSNLMQEINQSISFDQRLQADQSSVAHAKCLLQLKSSQKMKNCRRPENRKEIENGTFNFKIELSFT
jgi:argininosuccinate lyase